MLCDRKIGTLIPRRCLEYHLMNRVRQLTLVWTKRKFKGFCCDRKPVCCLCVKKPGRLALPSGRLVGPRRRLAQVMGPRSLWGLHGYPHPTPTSARRCWGSCTPPHVPPWGFLQAAVGSQARPLPLVTLVQCVRLWVCRVSNASRVNAPCHLQAVPSCGSHGRRPLAAHRLCVEKTRGLMPNFLRGLFCPRGAHVCVPYTL